MAALLSAGLSACQPADQNLLTVRERLEKGEVVEFSTPGYRRPSCSERNPDWTDVGLSNQDERARVVLGQQGSVLAPGLYSCYRVGSVIALKVSGKSGGLGFIQISKISLVRLENLKSFHLKGRFFASTSEFGRYLDGLKPRMQDPKYKGVVTIVDFRYIEGSALDEKAIRDEDQRKSVGDGYEETRNDGDTLSDCRSPWSYVSLPQEFLNPVKAGALKSWYQLGERNCFQQGQEASLELSSEGHPSVAKIRIIKIKRVKLSAIDAKYFRLLNFDFAAVKARILSDNQHNETWITIADFDLLSDFAARGGQ
jgi:hypothetical protein